MVKSEYISKGEVDNFVKRLELVLVYRIYNKDFRTYVDSKALTLKTWKWNYYSIIRKSLDLKVGIQAFFRNKFARTQEPVFLIYFLSIFLSFPWSKFIR